MQMIGGLLGQKENKLCGKREGRLYPLGLTERDAMEKLTQVSFEPDKSPGERRYQKI